jgi:hypothetical protein
VFAAVTGYLEAHQVDGVGVPLPETTPISHDEALAKAALKQRKLVQRTADLVRALDRLGKLDGDVEDYSEAVCTDDTQSPLRAAAAE